MSEKLFDMPESKPTPANPCIALFGPGPDGACCRDCSHMRGVHMSKTYWKCDLRRNTHGSATDHRRSWPACARFHQQTAQKYPDGSIVKVDGQEWTVVDMSRDSDGLLPGQDDRGENYNLYRLTRHNTKPILRWQHEIDAGRTTPQSS